MVVRRVPWDRRNRRPLGDPLSLGTWCVGEAGQGGPRPYGGLWSAAMGERWARDGRPSPPFLPGVSGGRCAGGLPGEKGRQKALVPIWGTRAAISRSWCHHHSPLARVGALRPLPARGVGEPSRANGRIPNPATDETAEHRPRRTRSSRRADREERRVGFAPRSRVAAARWFERLDWLVRRLARGRHAGRVGRRRLQRIGVRAALWASRCAPRLVPSKPYEHAV